MNEIPRHLGIIMDGNRRWAKAQGLPVFRGHAAGLEVLKKIIGHCQKRGVKILTVFAFSTENWQRPSREVNFLMALCRKAANRDLNDLTQNGSISLRIIGETKMLPRKLRDSLTRIEESTRGNQGMILNIALSYGGRAEIVSAVKAIAEKQIPAEEITEAMIAENLRAPDLDFLIRTGREQRLSNFLIWQAAYAELYFSRKCWPGFTEEDLDEALADFAARQRRRGK